MQPGGMSDALVEEAKSEEGSDFFPRLKAFYFCLLLNNSSSRAN